MSGFSMPKDWVMASISDVAVKGAQRKPDADEEFIYVDIGSINRNSKAIEEAQALKGKDAPSRARKVIHEGDVLVSLTRPNLNAVALVTAEYHGQIASTGFEVIKPVLVDSRYIFGLVRSRNFINEISGVVQGALYPAAKSSDVQSYSFPLPPLAEQKAIAEKLDTLLAQVESTKARLERIPKTLKRFRQSVLAAAVSGKLTDGGKFNPDNATSWSASFDVSVVVGHEMPYQIPDNWVWDHLGNLVAVHNGLRVPLKKSDRDSRPGQYPYYGAFGIIDDIDDYLFDGKYLLLAEDGKNLKSRERPISLIAEGKFWVNNHAHVLKEKNGVVLEYLAIHLNSPLLLIDQFLTGQDQVKLNKKAMVMVPIAVPPAEEQEEIVRRVDQLFAYADTIETQVNNALERVNNLTQSILAKAFRGELTEQWRKDNPDLISGENSAEALLEKIKAERAAAKPVKRGRKKV